MECGTAVSAGLRRGILFAGEPRLALAHGHWLCVHGLCSVFGCRNHQRLVGRKLLSYRIARRSRTILCVYWFSLDINPASNLLRRNVQATTDSDIFRVHPYDSLVRRTDGLRLHGSLHRAARKVAFQSSWLARGARELDYRRNSSQHGTWPVVEIRRT